MMIPQLLSGQPYLILRHSSHSKNFYVFTYQNAYLDDPELIDYEADSDCPPIEVSPFGGNASTQTFSCRGLFTTTQLYHSTHHNALGQRLCRMFGRHTDVRPLIPQDRNPVFSFIGIGWKPGLRTLFVPGPSFFHAIACTGALIFNFSTNLFDLFTTTKQMIDALHNAMGRSKMNSYSILSEFRKVHRIATWFSALLALAGNRVCEPFLIKLIFNPETGGTA